ncbi:MAG: fructose-bisphosphatase class II [Candidatus Levyibacteriota bacterium]
MEFHDTEGVQEDDVNKLGEAMPTIAGTHGEGEEKLSGAADEVEATTKVAHGWNGGISIIGITTYHGLTSLPFRESNPGRKIQHVEKLFGPKEYEDVVDIERPTDENIRAVMRQGIPAGDITWAVMERDCNATMMRRAKDLQVNLVRITSGDLEWGMKAILSDWRHPIFMSGRGGAPEGVIAMILARARSATGYLREMQDSDADVEFVKKGQIWRPQEFVPGAREHSMVIFSAVTNNDTFGLLKPAPHPKNGRLHIVESMVLNSSGMEKRRTVTPIVRYNVA